MLKELLLSRFSAQELSALVQQKQDNFCGLLTEEGAFRIIAHENGVKGEVEPFKFGTLSEAKEGAIVSAKVRVLHVFPPKSFETSERKGRLCKMRVADSSASAELVLWNSDVSFAYKVQRNDVLLVKNVFVKVLQPLELHSRMSSEISVAEDDPSIKRSPTPLCKVSTITGNEVDLFAKVVEKQPLKEFDRAGKKGHLTRLVVADDSGKIGVACWDENAKAAQEASVGEAVKIEGAVPRNGELHLPWSGRLLLNPKGHGLAGVEVMPYPHKLLAELGAEDAVVEARVERLVDAQRLQKCLKCGRKRVDGNCECGSTEARPLVYATIELSDQSGKMRAVLFDDAAEAFMGAKSTTDMATLASLKRDYLAGKTARFVGRAKVNPLSKEKELSAKAFLQFVG